jgi:hypothetical protein
VLLLYHDTSTDISTAGRRLCLSTPYEGVKQRETSKDRKSCFETLYSEWEKAARKDRYKVFWPALRAGLEKLEEYYERTAASDAHLIVMGVRFPEFRWLPLI